MPVHKNLRIKIISVGISYDSKISEAFKCPKIGVCLVFFNSKLVFRNTISYKIMEQKAQYILKLSL